MEDLASLRYLIGKKSESKKESKEEKLEKVEIEEDKK